MRQLLLFAIGGFGTSQTSQTKFDLVHWFLNHVPQITRAVIGALAILAVATVTVGATL